MMTVFAGQDYEFTGNLSQIAVAFDVPRRSLSWHVEGIRPESAEMIQVLNRLSANVPLSCRVNRGPFGSR